MQLKNKIVLVTGATSGIGLATAHIFASAGAKLLLCARRDELLKDLSSTLSTEYGVEVYSFILDVRQKEEVISSFNQLPAEWKKIDVLINNAGLAAGLDYIQDGSFTDWDDMIDTNVKGLLYVTQQILPQMIQRNSGHIVNIGSIASHEVYPKGAVYCASKHAVHAITQGLRMDVLGKNVKVSTVDPGAVETNFSNVRFKGDATRAAAVYKGMQPLQAQDIADAILYCVTRPAHVNINEIIIMPTDQASATCVSRKDN